MGATLKLVADNPDLRCGRRLDGTELRLLAARLALHVKAGLTGFAHAVSVIEHLNPMESAVVATCLVKAGLSEAQILAVLAGRQPPARKSGFPSRKPRHCA